MKINFNHNTVIKELITEGFLRYFNEGLVPLLQEKYGDSLVEVQLYEDYIDKKFSLDGEWFYPLSLLVGDEVHTEWVAWEYPKGNAFAEGVPYAYVAPAPLKFRLAPDTPAEFKNTLGDAPHFDLGDALPTSVGIVAGGIEQLIGKYSQSFLDALARTLTREIEQKHRVSGLKDSGIRLQMLFAPMTYMEHTCEGVTYRRLTMSEEGGRTEKDFWVRWQRANGTEPVTVSEDIREGDVIFSIGEDVSQKVREKEFRYLLRQNAEKYRSAMGRKTVTEWREFLKKAIRRGDLVRLDTPVEPPKEKAPEVQVLPETVKPVVEGIPFTYTPATEQVPFTNAPATEHLSVYEVPVQTHLTETTSSAEQTPVSEFAHGFDDASEQEEALEREELIVDDPWLARLKQFASDTPDKSGDAATPSPREEKRADTEAASPDEFLDAMSRMRSMLGIDEDSKREPCEQDEHSPLAENNENPDDFVVEITEEPVDTPEVAGELAELTVETVAEQREEVVLDATEERPLVETDMTEVCDGDTETQQELTETLADVEDPEENAPISTSHADPLFDKEPHQEAFPFDTEELLVIERIAPVGSAREALFAQNEPTVSAHEPVQEDIFSRNETVVPAPEQENINEDKPANTTPVQPIKESAPTEDTKPSEDTKPTEDSQSAVHTPYLSSDALRREIRRDILRELEARERERLAEEARRAVIEREEREAEMERIAREHAEAEESRQEIAELREQTRLLYEEVRKYSQICMDFMARTPAPVLPETEEPTQTEEPTKTEDTPEVDTASEEVSVEVVPVGEPQETIACENAEEGISSDQCELAESENTKDGDAENESTEDSDSNNEKTYTQSEVEQLLAEERARMKVDLEEQIRLLVVAQLQKQNAEQSASASPVPKEENAPSDNAPEDTPEDATLPSVEENSDEVGTADNGKTSAQGETVEISAEALRQQEIAELLAFTSRESEEEERLLQMQQMIREKEEKLEALRREEEERRERAEWLAKEQERLEELARVERERQQEERRRVEEERRRAEEEALQSYEKHLLEAKRIEEELETARKRREEEEARIAEAERKLAEQTRLAEEAREEQRRRNEEARRITEEGEERLSELYLATERRREMAERTEEESRLATQTIEQEEERMRLEAMRHEQEERQRAEAERLVEQRRQAFAASESAPQTQTPARYTYVSRVVHLTFNRAIDPNIIGKIHRLMSDTIAYFNKSDVAISVRAEIVGTMELDLNFVRIPQEEEPLLINIVKVLGRSNIGIRRAKIDD